MVSTSRSSREWPFLDAPGPLAFAHRGGLGEAPENSMAAFQSAVDMGYRHLETDVHLTADGEVVAFHDHVLDRVTDRLGVIERLDWSEIKHARIGGVEPIPLFAELLHAWPDVRINIDPKHDAVVAPLAKILLDADAVDRVCVGSFSDRRIVAAVERLGPRLCTGMGPRSIARLIAAGRGAPVGAIPGVCAQVPVGSGPVPVVTERFVAEAHRRDIAVHVWTIDEPAEMARLLDLGVDGIMTDRPRVLRDVMIERGDWVPIR